MEINEVTPNTTQTNAANSSAQPSKAPATKKKPWWRKALKITAWTLMAIVLFVYGLVVGTVVILTPERLTPLVTKVANKSLNADVSIGRVELTMKSSFPFIEATVDDLVVISRDTKALDDETREMYPEWIDTVAVIKKFEGGVNIPQLLTNTLSISDVKITRPAINLATLDDETVNYNIFPESSDTTAFDFASLPDIKMKRFEIVEPQPVRYYDGESDATIVARFSQLNLDGNEAPKYTLNINSEFEAPMLEFFSLDKLVFGLNGDIEWSQQNPLAIALNNFKFELAILKGVISTSVDFTEELKVNTLDLNLEPISVAQVLSMIPEEMLEENADMLNGIDTGAEVNLDFKLTKPYNVATDLLPIGVLNVKIPETYLTWDKLRLETLLADVTVTTTDQEIDHAVVKINEFKAAGPATTIEAVGSVTNLMSDPTFEGDIDGTVDLNRLPPVLKQLVGGSLSGRLTACVIVSGRQSMFVPTKFHQLTVTGDVNLTNFRWASNDAANNVYVGRASFKLGTNSSYKDETRNVSGLTTAKITVDTAFCQQDDVMMSMSDISLGVGTRMTGQRDTTQVVPIGGKVHVGRFTMRSDVDSTNLRLREVDGSVVVRAHNGDYKTPEINFDLGLRRVSMGSNSTRVSMSRATAQFTAIKQPSSERGRSLKKLADSLRVVHPKLSTDSISNLARAIYRQSRSSNGNRTKHTTISDDQDVIDWGMTGEFKRLLNDWTLSGSLTAGKASMFTPAFPLRNRLKDIDMTFNNDTIKVKKVNYTVGRSDFAISGEITNIRRALTSRSGRSPLKVIMDLKSDTIDVNQLADAVFTGAAYAENVSSIDLSNVDSEEALDSIISANALSNAEASAFLVPMNIEATLRARSKNIIYSDLTLNDFRGEVLAYQGALNLHRLRAGSEVGKLNMSALYMGAKRDSLSFSFGLQVDSFNIRRFTQLVPAMDTLMPMLDNLSGIISADIAASTDLYNNMDLDMSTLSAAIKLAGDSLVLIDPDTFKSLSKWLLFKNKNRNIIDHMSVEMTVQNGLLNIYPFIFDIDRYRLGIQGYNDMALNFNYHIAVFKSPIPFKFGINVSGNPDKFKVRLGGVKFKENSSALQVAVVDTTRVNLLTQIENVFRRGIQNSRPVRVNVKRENIEGLQDEKLTHADSLKFIEQGLIEKPDSTTTTTTTDDSKSKKKRGSSKKKKSDETAAISTVISAVNRLTAVVDDRRINPTKA